MQNINFYAALATLVGSIIGAGILGIPYVASKAGFLTAFAIIIFLGLIMLLVHLLLGEVVARTKGKHQLTGYSSIYLGRWGKRLMTGAMIFGIYGALLAYMVGEGEVLQAIFGGTTTLWTYVFFVAASSIVLGGIELLKRSELYMMSLETIILFIIVFSLILSPQFDTENLQTFSLQKIFIPYGVVLFAYLGTSAVPQVWLELKNRKQFKYALIIGSIIPIIIYTLFPFVVLGVLGSNTTQVATIGIGNLFGYLATVIFNLLAFLTMSTSFLALGFALKEMYEFDYKLSGFLSWLLTIVLPFILYLLGFNNFTKILGTTGAVTGGLTAILVVLMHIKSKKLSQRIPEYKIKVPYFIYGIIILVFIFGALLELGIL